MTTQTRDTYVPLQDRAVMSLNEACKYAHVGDHIARDLCLTGVREMREQGAVTEGWECWTVGGGHWRISRASIDQWIHLQAVEHALSDDRPIGVRPGSSN